MASTVRVIAPRTILIRCRWSGCRGVHAPVPSLRFTLKLRDELLKGGPFYALQEAQELVERWRQRDNAHRSPSALEYRSLAPDSGTVAPIRGLWACLTEPVAYRLMAVTHTQAHGCLATSALRSAGHFSRPP